MKIIFLIGYMGSGKTTMGKKLAEAIQWKFIDLDDYIEQRTKTSISSIFHNQGEKVFRDIEREALEEVIKFDEVVVATGGGAPCFYDNMDFMKLHGFTLYLKLSPKELCNRLLLERATRPLIAQKSDAELLIYIEEKLLEREIFYNQAHAFVDATTTSISTYVDIVKSNT